MWVVSPEQWTAIEEIETGSDRVAAIVAAALIEAAIQDIVSNFLKIDDAPLTKKIRKNLLAVDGPLGTVGARVWLAYLLKIISADMCTDINNISEIRNKFAHYSAISSFDNEPIADKCRNFKLIDQSFRVLDAMGSVTLKDGGVKKFETAGYVQDKDGIPYATISVLDRNQKISTPRGRYLLTAKLIMAAFYIFHGDGLLPLSHGMIK